MTAGRVRRVVCGVCVSHYPTGITCSAESPKTQTDSSGML